MNLVQLEAVLQIMLKGISTARTPWAFKQHSRERENCQKRHKMLLEELQKATFNFFFLKFFSQHKFIVHYFFTLSMQGNYNNKKQNSDYPNIKTITNHVNEQVIGPLYQHYTCNLRYPPDPSTECSRVKQTPRIPVLAKTLR